MTTSEVMEQNGVVTRIRRNFVYIVKKSNDAEKYNLLPRLYVLKCKDSRTSKEKFLCRIKGSLYTVKDDKLFFVIFSHSLHIDLTPSKCAK